MSASSILYEGDYFANFTNTIVITGNYRLGALGYAVTEKTLTGDYGLEDQLLTMQWIKLNAKVPFLLTFLFLLFIVIVWLSECTCMTFVYIYVGIHDRRLEVTQSVSPSLDKAQGQGLLLPILLAHGALVSSSAVSSRATPSPSSTRTSHRLRL